MARALQEAVQTLCERGHLARALETLCQSPTTNPSTSTYLHLLTACSKGRALTYTRLVHAHILLLGSVLTAPLGNYVLVALARCGALDDALYVSSKLSQRSVFSWTAIITGFADSGDPYNALRMHELMMEDGVEPDAYTFVSLLKACGDISDVALGTKLHTNARQRGFTTDIFITSSLVIMYGRCGAILEAENVFADVSERDVVVWNAMLSTYVEHGERHKAIEFYQKMQEHSVSPNYRTYVSALQACAIVAEHKESVLMQDDLSHLTPLQYGQALHSDAVMRGFTSNTFIGNSLLTMYGKCVAFVEAEYVFCTLADRDGVSWNAMLTAYVIHGQVMRALHLYSYLIAEGFIPDEITYLSALQACVAIIEMEKEIDFKSQSSKTIALEIGQSLHVDACRKGCGSCPMIYNTLLSLYGKCGAVVEAEHAFGEMVNTNVVSWNSILSVYIEQGQGKSALQLYAKMELEGVSPDEGTSVLAIQACAILAEEEEFTPTNQNFSRSAALDIAYALHTQAHKKGFTDDLYVGCSLLSMYGRCHAIMEAELVFASQPHHVVPAWNAMIAAYASQGQELDALQLCRQMQEESVCMDKRTYSTTILACATLVEKEYASHSEHQQALMMAREIGKALHGDAKHACLASHALVGTSLMAVYSKCGAITEVEHVFCAILHKDTVAWNAMLSAYVQHGMGESALQLYAWMTNHEKVSLEHQTFVIALQACTSLGRRDHETLIQEESTRSTSLQIGRAVHSHASSQGFAANAMVGSALVNMYGKLGSNTEAEHVLSGLPRRTVVTWSAMLSAYVEEHEGEKAVQLYREMQRHDVAPNHITVTSILQACIATGSFELCNQLHFDIVSAGYDQILSVSATLINAYGSHASMVDAQVSLDRLPEVNIVSWNAYLCGLAGYGDHEASLGMFEHLKQLGRRPDELTMTTVLATCSRSGLVTEGYEYFQSSNRDYDVHQDRQHYGTMLDLVSRAGDFKRARKLLQTMPMEADPDSLLSLLGACCAHGELEVARQTFDMAVNLQPQQATTYVLMSNVYAGSALQEFEAEAEDLAWLGG